MITKVITKLVSSLVRQPAERNIEVTCNIYVSLEVMRIRPVIPDILVLRVTGEEVSKHSLDLDPGQELRIVRQSPEINN